MVPLTAQVVERSISQKVHDGSNLVSKIGKIAYFKAFSKLNKGSGSAYKVCK